MIYFDLDDTWTTKEQNAGVSGFNQWARIEYKPDPLGLGMLATLGINAGTQWTYNELVAWIAAEAEMAAATDADGVITDLSYNVEESLDVMTETLLIDVETEPCNPFYFCWINRLGGMEYEMFSHRQVQGVDLDKGETINANFDVLHTAWKREFSIGSRNRQEFKIYKNAISYTQKERYIDLKRSLNYNGLMYWTKKFNGIIQITDYSGTIANTVRGYSAGHKLETGDEIIISGTTDYNRAIEIIKINEDYFYFAETYTSDQSGAWQRVVKESDWLFCQAEMITDEFLTDSKTFDVEIKILLPSDE